MFFKRDWSIDGLKHTWAGELRAVYDHLREGRGNRLPDDEAYQTGEIRYASGLVDSLFGHRLDSTRDVSAERIVELLKGLVRNSSNRALRDLYRILNADSPISHVDEVLERLTKDLDPVTESRLHEIGLFLSTRSPHRDPVKFGIALLGVAGSPSDVEVIRTLGGHDEFALYAGVALARLSDDPESEIWELAKRVAGWGRIQLVEQLAETERPEIRAWLLRDGFRNSIMDEYLAYTCAKAGQLELALGHLQVDDALLNGAAGILQALISGGPAQDIEDYDEAPTAVDLYVNLVWSRPVLGLDHFLAVDDIRRYLADRATDHTRWPADLRERLLATCADVLGRGEWAEKARIALASDNEDQVWRGDRACSALGIDAWDRHVARVKIDTLNSLSWSRLASLANEDRIDGLVELASNVIPLDEIATGPAEELGLGPEYQPHNTLDWVLQALPRFPEKGWVLIQTGLASPVVRNRNLAMRALAVWPKGAWPEDAEPVVQKAMAEEPDEAIRENLRKVLRGEALAEPRLIVETFGNADE